MLINDLLGATNNMLHAFTIPSPASTVTSTVTFAIMVLETLGLVKDQVWNITFYMLYTAYDHQIPNDNNLRKH